MMTEHELAAAAAETGIRADVLAVYLEAGCTIAEAVEAERANERAEMPIGSGIIRVMKDEPFNGREWRAEVVKIRTFKGRITDEIVIPCVRYGHTVDEAARLCLHAARETTEYSCFNWRPTVAAPCPCKGHPDPSGPYAHDFDCPRRGIGGEDPPFDTSKEEAMAAQIEGTLPDGIAFLDGLSDDDLSVFADAATIASRETDVTAGILSFGDMIEQAEIGRARITDAVQYADLDAPGVLNRVLAFVEAHGLGPRLAAYIIAQADHQLAELEG